MSILSIPECASALKVEVNDPVLALVLPGCESAVFNHLRFNPSKRELTEFYPFNQERISGGEYSIANSTSNRVNFAVGGSVFGDTLILSETPVWNDETLEVREQYGGMASQSEDPFPDSSLLSKGTDYWLDCDSTGSRSLSGILYRIGGNWCPEPRSIMVTYNGGNTSDDFDGLTENKVADIKLALLYAVMWNYKQVILNSKQELAGFTAGPLASEKTGLYSYRIASAQVKSYNFSTALPPSCIELLQPHRSYRGIF